MCSRSIKTSNRLLFTVLFLNKLLAPQRHYARRVDEGVARYIGSTSRLCQAVSHYRSCMELSTGAMQFLSTDFKATLSGILLRRLQTRCTTTTTTTNGRSSAAAAAATGRPIQGHRQRSAARHRWRRQCASGAHVGLKPGREHY